MKRKDADNIDDDVLDRLTLRSRTDAELLVLLGIMNKQQRCFTAMACRRLSKSVWHAIAPLKHRAGWLCAAVSGMLFITATSVAYNEYAMNSNLRTRLTHLQFKLNATRPSPNAAAVTLVNTSRPVNESCIPVRTNRAEYMSFPACGILPTHGKARRELLEKFKKVATMCIAPEIQTSNLSLAEPSLP